MPELPPKVIPTAKPSATKAASTSSKGQQQQQAQPPPQAQKQQQQKQQQQRAQSPLQVQKQQQQTQQRKPQQEVPLTDRTRASSPAPGKNTAPPKESRPTSRPGSSRGANERTEEDPSDPVVVNYEGADRFYSFAEKEQIWDYVMKSVGNKKPGVKQPEVRR